MIEIAAPRPRVLSSPDLVAMKAALLRELGVDEDAPAPGVPGAEASRKDPA